MESNDIGTGRHSTLTAAWARNPEVRAAIDGALSARARVRELSLWSDLPTWLSRASERASAEEALRDALLALGAVVAESAEVAARDADDPSQSGLLATAANPLVTPAATAPPLAKDDQLHSDHEAEAASDSGRRPEVRDHLPTGSAGGRALVSAGLADPARGSDRSDDRRAPPLVVTSAHKERLQAALNDRQLGVVGRPPRDAEANVRALRTAIGRLGRTPPARASKKIRDRELRLLLDVIGSDLDTWAALPTVSNYVLTSWVAARLRALQDASGERPISARPDSPIASAIRALGAHSKASRPGVVHGLAQRHQPRMESWSDDARLHEAKARELAGLESATTPHEPVIDDLVRRLNADIRNGMTSTVFIRRVSELIEAGARPQDKRIARLAYPFAEDLREAGLLDVARAAEAMAEAEADADESPTRPTAVPPDWPYFAHTAGKKAVIVGGEPRAERLKRLEEAFRFSELEWLDKAHSGGAIDSIVERMRSGSLDMVIALRAFSSHKLTDKLFANQCETCRLVLADTYGVTQVRLGIERFCR